MMKVSYVGLIICCAIALSLCENTLAIEFITKCKSNSGCETQQTSESRYRDSYSEFAKQDYVKRKVDLPVNFRAPNYAAYDYWSYKEEQQQQQQQQQQQHQQDHRRTFFEDTFYYPHDKRTTYPRVNDFYQFVTSMFGLGSEATTRPGDFRYDRNHETSPYPYGKPGSFDFRPTQPNYIPPPKPIRASVIKLETITRSPDLYPSFDYDTGKFYQTFGNILNPVIIQNSKNRQNPALHDYRGDSSKKLIPNPSVSFPVLPKPLAPPPTTLKPPPEFSHFFTSRPSPGISYVFDHSKNSNQTDYKYPDSVQDKLPPIDFGSVSYFLATGVPTITTTLTPETLSTTNYNEKFFFPTNAPAIQKTSTNIIDIRNLNLRPTTEIERIKNFDFDVTTFESLDKSFQKIRGPQRSSIKKFNPSNETSVEIITNLTVEGLSKSKSDNANIQNHVNYFNVRNLITYEMNKLKNTPTTESDRFLRKSPTNESLPKTDDKLPSRLVNFNDELSLDAKILKDTNWDGFLTPISNATIEIHPTAFFQNQTQHQEAISNSPSIQDFRFKPKLPESRINYNKTKVEKDFWESDAVRETTVFDAEVTTILDEKTTTEKLGLSTTTEIQSFQTVSEATEMTEPITSSEVTTTQDENLASMKSKDSPEQETTIEPFTKTTTEKPASKETSKASSLPERTTPYYQKRKYSRRAKFLNFTPYTSTTTTELPKKVFNRNNFPRRQKPNITLAFGNKNIIKNLETYAKDEVMKFSDEDLTKRKRKIGKRRQPSKRKNSTTEPTVLE